MPIEPFDWRDSLGCQRCASLGVFLPIVMKFEYHLKKRLCGLNKGGFPRILHGNGNHREAALSPLLLKFTLMW